MKEVNNTLIFTTQPSRSWAILMPPHQHRIDLQVLRGTMKLSRLITWSITCNQLRILNLGYNYPLTDCLAMTAHQRCLCVQGGCKVWVIWPSVLGACDFTVVHTLWARRALGVHVYMYSCARVHMCWLAGHRASPASSSTCLCLGVPIKQALVHDVVRRT